MYSFDVRQEEISSCTLFTALLIDLVDYSHQQHRAYPAWPDLGKFCSTLRSNNSTNTFRIKTKVVSF
jgi:hypothetical protein